MLGFGAIAEVALADIPLLTSDTAFDTPAWKRWHYQRDARHTINRQAPRELAWHDDEDLEIILLNL